MTAIWTVMARRSRIVVGRVHWSLWLALGLGRRRAGGGPLEAPAGGAGRRRTRAGVAEAAAAYEQRRLGAGGGPGPAVAEDRRPDDPEAAAALRAGIGPARARRDGRARSTTDRLGAAQMRARGFVPAGSRSVRAGKLETALELWEKAAQERPGSSRAARQSDAAVGPTAAAGPGGRRGPAAGAPARLGSARHFCCSARSRRLLDDPKGAVDAIRQGLERDPTAKGAPFAAAHYRKLLARSLLRARPAGRGARGACSRLGRTGGPADVDREADWLLSRAYLQEGQIAGGLGRTRALAGSYRAENPLDARAQPLCRRGALCVPATASEARRTTRPGTPATFHHGRGLLDLPLPDRPLADPDDPKVTHTFKREGRQDQGRDPRRRPGLSRWSSSMPSGRATSYVTMIGRDDEQDYRALRLSSYHTPRGRLGTDLRRRRRLRLGREHPRRADRRARRRRPLPVLPRHRLSRFSRPAARDRRRPGGRRLGDRLRAVPRPGRQPHRRRSRPTSPDRAIVNAGAATPAAIDKLSVPTATSSGLPAEIRTAPDDPQFVRSPGRHLDVQPMLHRKRRRA